MAGNAPPRGDYEATTVSRVSSLVLKWPPMMSKSFSSATSLNSPGSLFAIPRLVAVVLLR